MAEPTPAQIEAGAHLTLVRHQRLDAGSCVCGWGVNTGDLGRSHSLHVWRELQRAVLPDHDARVRADERAKVAEAIARDIERCEVSNDQELMGLDRAAAIARQHTTGEDT